MMDTVYIRPYRCHLFALNFNDDADANLHNYFDEKCIPQKSLSFIGKFTKNFLLSWFRSPAHFRSLVYHPIYATQD